MTGAKALYCRAFSQDKFGEFLGQDAKRMQGTAF